MTISGQIEKILDFGGNIVFFKLPTCVFLNVLFKVCQVSAAYLFLRGIFFSFDFVINSRFYSTTSSHTSSTISSLVEVVCLGAGGSFSGVGGGHSEGHEDPYDGEGPGPSKGEKGAESRAPANKTEEPRDRAPAKETKARVLTKAPKARALVEDPKARRDPKAPTSAREDEAPTHS